MTQRPQNDSSTNSLDQVVWPPNAKRPGSQDNNSIKTLKKLFPLHKTCLWLRKVVKCVASVALSLQSVTCWHIVFWRVNYKAFRSSSKSSNACNASQKCVIFWERDKKKAFSKPTSDNLAKKFLSLIAGRRNESRLEIIWNKFDLIVTLRILQCGSVNNQDQIVMISFPLEKMCLWIWICLKSCCA